MLLVTENVTKNSMCHQSSIVTILTDFQPGNFYSAQMKGILLSRVPGVRIVEITESVLPQNILHGALILTQTVPFFPEKTVHIAVVDPGVGTERELLCAVLNEKWGQQRIVCPNNGLLTFLLEKDAVSEVFFLKNSACVQEKISSTFHGRDILAPAAACLANGGKPDDLGPPVKQETLLRLNFPKPEIRQEENSLKITGEILFADSFGNLVTNVTHRDFSVFEPFSGQTFEGTAQLGGMRFLPVRTYAEQGVGTPVVLFGSQGFLELAIVNGNLAQSGNFPPGTRFSLEVRR